MFDHVKFGVSDYAASKAFFSQALASLGVTLVGEANRATAQSWPAAAMLSCLYQVRKNRRRCLIAYRADSRGQVDALLAGGAGRRRKDNGAPGLRPNYHASYYAAFVIAPDGHNSEAVCHLAG